MKKNDIIELKSKTTDELNKMLTDLRAEISKAATERSLGKLKNTNLVKNKKKDVARVMTFLSMRKLMEGKESK